MTYRHHLLRHHLRSQHLQSQPQNEHGAWRRRSIAYYYYYYSIVDSEDIWSDKFSNLICGFVFFLGGGANRQGGVGGGRITVL